jgi:post-segregation antitoxin (ccd killing protein)
VPWAIGRLLRGARPPAASLSGWSAAARGTARSRWRAKRRKGHVYYVCEYATRYGDEAGLQAHDGQKFVSAREDRLVRLVLRFFEQRVFGPLRLERLEKQLRAQARSERRNGKEGVEPELVSERIAELRGEKEALEEALAEVGAEREEAEDEELTKQLARVPDLSQALAEACPEVQRQVFQAFDLQIAFDKAERGIEISATVSEALAEAFENAKALQKEGSAVVVKDIAGARFVSRYHRRIVELTGLNGRHSTRTTPRTGLSSNLSG